MLNHTQVHSTTKGKEKEDKEEKRIFFSSLTNILPFPFGLIENFPSFFPAFLVTFQFRSALIAAGCELQGEGTDDWVTSNQPPPKGKVK
jgi:hypothetical protein